MVVVDMNDVESKVVLEEGVVAVEPVEVVVDNVVPEVEEVSDVTDEELLVELPLVLMDTLVLPPVPLEVEVEVVEMPVVRVDVKELLLVPKEVVVFPPMGPTPLLLERDVVVLVMLVEVTVLSLAAVELVNMLREAEVDGELDVFAPPVLLPKVLVDALGVLDEPEDVEPPIGPMPLPLPLPDEEDVESTEVLDDSWVVVG
ncbi:hypothetical protein AYL99_01809 [Fonsecaea erecta]|uniref:Uncharacterized protein n=1 Tax=Fonsecaea erecta TaxID=1367422 RepID=A0A178ZSE2_9EURO|nr:hypothetical protein AYL99_01809 [Fonsecaea erecta]OAP62582.1 hypothetical protein AYL99_01809 [Fonsecaea erecta]